MYRHKQSEFKLSAILVNIITALLYTIYRYGLAPQDGVMVKQAYLTRTIMTEWSVRSSLGATYFRACANHHSTRTHF